MGRAVAASPAPLRLPIVCRHAPGPLWECASPGWSALQLPPPCRRPPALRCLLAASLTPAPRASLSSSPQQVRQEDLERHDGVPSGKYTVGLGQQGLSFCGDREDTVSMALTALRRLLERHGVSPLEVGRLEVGTESSVDSSKSVKTYLMALFEEAGNTDVEVSAMGETAAGGARKEGGGLVRERTSSALHGEGGGLLSSKRAPPRTSYAAGVRRAAGVRLASSSAPAASTPLPLPARARRAWTACRRATAAPRPC